MVEKKNIKKIKKDVLTAVVYKSEKWEMIIKKYNSNFAILSFVDIEEKRKKYYTLAITTRARDEIFEFKKALEFSKGLDMEFSFERDDLIIKIEPKMNLIQISTLKDGKTFNLAIDFEKLVEKLEAVCLLL